MLWSSARHGMARLVAGVRWVRCRQLVGCQGSNGPMPVIGWIDHAVLEGYRVTEEGSSIRFGLVASEPRSPLASAGHDDG